MFDHVLRELYPRPLQIGPRGLRTARVSACLLASALDLWWGAGGQYIRHIPHLPELATWGASHAGR